MQVGDLVKTVIEDPSVHTQRPFLVTETREFFSSKIEGNWIKLLGFPEDFFRAEGWMVINASR